MAGETFRAPNKTALAAVPILGTFPGGEDAAWSGVLLGALRVFAAAKGEI
jgi:hypothetical protein